MAISFVNATSVAGATLSTQTGTEPTGVVANDFELLATCCSVSTLPSWNATTYTGWTTQINTFTTSLMFLILYRIADGTSTDVPPAIGTTATGNRVTVCGAWRGVDTTTPLLASNGQAETVSGTTHVAPSITNTDAGAWAIFQCFLRQVATPLNFTGGSGLTTTERTDIDCAVATTQNAAGTIYDSNGVVAAQSAAFGAVSNTATARGYMWGAFLKPAGAAAAATIYPPPRNFVARNRAANW